MISKTALQTVLAAQMLMPSPVESGSKTKNYNKIPLTKRQKKLRAKNKMQRKSRKINRK